MRSAKVFFILLLVLSLVAASSLAAHQPNHDPPGQGNGEGMPHPVEACSRPYHLQAAGWDLCWQQDDVRVQGLEVNRVYFHNESVIWKMGVPFTLTKYERGAPGPFKDVLGRPDDAFVPGFGQGSMEIAGDACPRFMPQGELLNDGRLCVEHRQGPNPALSLWARYDLYNYRFLQGYHFDARGNIEPFLSLGGHLIDGDTIGADGQNHYHHIYWRVDFDIASPGNDVFQIFKRLHGENLISQDLGLEQPCTPTGGLTLALWCDIPYETKLTYDHRTYDRWRVKNGQDQNTLGRDKSFEFLVRSDAPANDFSTFDAMVLQHKGDGSEIGYEVPSRPRNGDEALTDYMIPPEPIDDPVVWLVHHNYHDTRDEDRISMAYHDVGFLIKPKDFLSENPAESTFP